MRKLLFVGCILGVVWSGASYAITTVSLGANIGRISFQGDPTFKPGVVFGLDGALGLTRILSVSGHIQRSTHSAGEGDLTLWSNLASLNVRPIEAHDLDFRLSFGPGMYHYNLTPENAIKVGLHVGAAINYIIGNVYLGTTSRLHFVDNPFRGSNYFVFRAQIGFIFGRETSRRFP